MKIGERLAVVETDVKMIKKMLYVILITLAGTTGVNIAL
jgi:hypothetical protein